MIGNDWVHIVFNESGREEYAFGTIPSQFNYVNIVVSPNTRGGVSLGSVGPIDTSYYLVSLQRRPGLPPFSPVGDNGVLVSAGNLPLLVRSLALNANVMCQIVNDTGGEAMRAYKSNWCVRLNHVTRFRGMWEEKKRVEREKRREAAEEGGAGGGGGAGGVEQPGDGGKRDPRDFTAFA